MARKTANQKLTKTDRLIRMLSAKTGADAAAISKKLGWQVHTTRAAITGLRKSGYEVATDKPDGKATRYRILADPDAKAGVGGDDAAAEVASAG